MNSPIETYIRLKKITKDTNIEAHPLIDESIKIHAHYFDDVEVTPIRSTDVFPEVIFNNNNSHVLFDINYSRYIEQLYNNIRFSILLNSSDHTRLISNIIGNIKSDAYHFLSVLSYDDEARSLRYIRKSKALFNNPGVHREADQFDFVFLIAFNLYLIRHEVAHSKFSFQDSSRYRKGLDSAIKSALNRLKNNELKVDEKIEQISKKNAVKIDNAELAELIENMLNNQEVDSLYEELFCDYMAFMDVLRVFEALHSDNANKVTKSLIAVHQALSIFDMLSDYYRRISGKISQAESIAKTTIRHSINVEIKSSVLIKMILSRGHVESPHLLQHEFTSSSYALADLFQDFYFSELLKIIVEVRSNVLLKTNEDSVAIDSQHVLRERDALLNW